MISLDAIAQFLNIFFKVESYNEDERGGVYLPSSRPIERLGLALEPRDGLYEWIITQNLDALFLHRPWKLETAQLPPVGVISYHLPFDELLTLGFNPRLADILNLSNLEILGEKQNRAIGMIGNTPNQTFTELSTCINQIFGGYEQIQAATQIEIKKIAVVGAMTDLLVRQAASRGTDVYITGQLRQPAAQAIIDTQIGFISIGHYRTETWGLRVLASLLQQRWSKLKVVSWN